MNYIEGTPREQMVMFSPTLEAMISLENPVRVVDAYVDSLDLGEMGFELPKMKMGPPPYRPQLLLKIYVYGYLKKIRSSRKLEEACSDILGMMWLTQLLKPDFKTIADFRKNNKKGIKAVFKDFLKFCNAAGLLSFEIVAIDGTKLRAQNSLNEIYNRDTIDAVAQKIQEKIDKYMVLLDEGDKAEEFKFDKEGVKNIAEKLEKQKKRKIKIAKIKELFETNPELKVYYATDSTCRKQSDKGKVRPGYNAQTAVDDKNKIIVVPSITNEANDLNQLTPMVEKVKEAKRELDIEEKTKVPADAGYFSENNVMNNKDDDSIEIIVPDPKKVNEKRKGNENEKLLKKDFTYNEEKDVYICPEGNELDRRGTYKKKKLQVIAYKCSACKNCKRRDKCTTSKEGRRIERSVNEKEMEKFKEKMERKEYKSLINKRKEIVEHPFGTIKRTMGYTYFMQRGQKKVETEFSFICFIYNLKRILNIIPIKELIESFKARRYELRYA